VAILVSRSQLAAVGVAATAIVLGLIAGGALAFATGGILDFGDCVGVSSGDLQRQPFNGQLAAGGSVTLRLSCGDLNLVSGAGSSWSLDAAYRGPAPSVDASSENVTVRAPEGGLRRQDWTFTAPRDTLQSLNVQADAAQTSLDLSSMHLEDVRVQANAGDLVLVGTGTSIGDIDVTVNAGRARLTFDGQVDGSLTVNAGSIDACVPANADLRFEVPTSFAFDTNLGAAGLVHDGDTWRRAGSGGPSIDLQIEGNAAGFHVNPPGGCR
jgi:hypothetical protein